MVRPIAHSLVFPHNPVCGSLAGNRYIRPNDQPCTCDSGWEGINCNICNSDRVCDSLVPTQKNATCYNSFMPVNRNHIQCNVNNPKILDLLAEQGRKPYITVSCTKNSCDFQFWTNQLESFFCKMRECSAKSNSKITDGVITNSTALLCNKIECKCYPDRLLCDKNALDIGEWFASEEGPKGPGLLECQDNWIDGKTARTCSFREDNMNKFIMQMFGDSFLTMDCNQAGECLHYTQIPDYVPDLVSSVSLFFIVGLVSGCIGLLLSLTSLFFCIKKRVMGDTVYYSRLQDDTLTEEQRIQNMMNHHSACTIMFRDICYSLDAKSVPNVGNNVTQGAEMEPNANTIKILDHVQGVVKPGQVMAIMGGSGAGKTTFLDILARKRKSGLVTGDILINGKFMEYEDYQNIIGYSFLT